MFNFAKTINQARSFLGLATPSMSAGRTSARPRQAAARAPATAKLPALVRPQLRPVSAAVKEQGAVAAADRKPSRKVYTVKDDLPQYIAVVSREGQEYALPQTAQQVMSVLLLEESAAGNVYCVLATGDHFNSALYRDYLQRIEASGGRCRGNGVADAGLISSLARSSAASSDTSEQTTIVRAVLSLFEQAVELKSSDIHIESMGESVEVRMRINGSLRVVSDTWTPEYVEKLALAMYAIAEPLTKPKVFKAPCNFLVMADLPNGVSVQARVEILSTFPKGVDVIFRLQNRSTGSEHEAFDSLENLGFHADQIEEIELMQSLPHSLILALGITGAGKSRTLGTLLDLHYQAHGKTMKRITVESPVEQKYRGCSQISCNPEDFTATLRQILRSDPDLLMVGEIRDEETTELVMNFVLSGHPCMSTLHCDDAPTAVMRLHDKGITLPVLADSTFLGGFIAQKLVPVLCEHCKVEYSPHDASLPGRLHKWVAETTLASDQIYVASADGCAHCKGLGTKGRTVVAETVVFNAEMREAIARGQFSEIRNIWRKQRELDGGAHMHGATKTEHAIYKMRQGRLSPLHVVRELGYAVGEIIQC